MQKARAVLTFHNSLSALRLVGDRYSLYTLDYGLHQSHLCKLFQKAGGVTPQMLTKVIISSHHHTDTDYHTLKASARCMLSDR